MRRVSLCDRLTLRVVIPSSKSNTTRPNSASGTATDGIATYGDLHSASPGGCGRAYRDDSNAPCRRSRPFSRCQTGSGRAGPWHTATRRGIPHTTHSRHAACGNRSVSSTRHRLLFVRNPIPCHCGCLYGKGRARLASTAFSFNHSTRCVTRSSLSARWP